MNRVYRVVRNAATGQWVVASELAKGHTKCAKHPALLSSLLLLSLSAGDAFASNCGLNMVASGGTCQLQNINPADNDGQSSGALANGGEALTVKGLATAIRSGMYGGGSRPLSDFNPSASNYERLNLSAKSQGISTPDPATGGKIIVATYTSSGISTSDWGQYPVTGASNIGDNQYIGTVLATAQGGSVTMNIGDAAAAPSAGSNKFVMYAKNTVLGLADGAGSTLEWASRNHIEMSGIYTAPGTSTSTITATVPLYAGSFTGFDGRSYTVTNAADLRAYNDVLIDALKSGKISSQAGYDAAFNAAVTFQK